MLRIINKPSHRGWRSDIKSMSAPWQKFLVRQKTSKEANFAMPIQNKVSNVEVTSYQPVSIIYHVCVPAGQSAKIKNNGPKKCHLTLPGEKVPNTLQPGAEMVVPAGTNILGCETTDANIEVLPA